MKTIKLIGKGLRRKKKINEDDLLSEFKEDDKANSNNISNEKVLNKTIRDVISRNKKLNKPINTHVLINK